MKRAILILFLLFLPLLVGATEIQKVGATENSTGFSITNPNYPDGVLVDIKDSKTFSSNEVYFSAKNTGFDSLNITATAEVLHFENWKQNFTIRFNEPFRVLAPNETFKFIPTIIFNVNLQNNYSIHFIFRGLQSDANGTVSVAKAHGRQINFRVVSNLIGHELVVRTTDQGDWERKSNIKIWYGGNEKQGRAYTIFKDLINTATYSSIVLEGWYLIKTEMNDGSAEHEPVYVRVNESKKINIVYKLVSINILITEFPATYQESLKFTYTIRNDYISLDNVELTFQTYRETKNESNPLIAVTDTIRHPILSLPKTSYTYPDNISFGGGWITGDYILRASIFVGNELYYQIDYELVFIFDWYKDFERSESFLPVIMIFTLIIGGTIPISFIKIKEKIKLKRLNEKNEQSTTD